MSEKASDNPKGGQGPDTGKTSKIQKLGEALVGKTLFNQYEVLEVLGESSMSLVVKAKDVLSNRLVAIKTVIPTDSEVVQRFAQEVQLHKRLKHKNIAEAVDCLATSTGRIFFVMEFLSGTSLHKVLQNTHRIRDEENLASIIIQICDALSHAHEMGVLHRDLKPGNIFLSEEGGQYYVIVLDFGIAKPLGQPTGLTHAGYAVGSPLYMSPEQCRGQPADPRSDVYSLGILTYEMATGELPYPGHNVMTVMAAHCDPKRKPPHLSKHVPKLRRVDHLNAIIQTAMETEADKRFQNIEDYKKAVELWYEAIQSDMHAARSHAIVPPNEMTKNGAADGTTSSSEPAEKIASAGSPGTVDATATQAGSPLTVDASAASFGSHVTADAVAVPTGSSGTADSSAALIFLQGTVDATAGSSGTIDPNAMPARSPATTDANAATVFPTPIDASTAPAIWGTAANVGSTDVARISIDTTNTPIEAARALFNAASGAKGSSPDLAREKTEPTRARRGTSRQSVMTDYKSQMRNRLAITRHDTGLENRTKALVVSVVIAIVILAVALFAMARFLLLQ